MPPTETLISELRQEIALLKQKQQWFEDEHNEIEARLSDTRKTLFAEREARQKLESEFRKTLARYGGVAGGMLLVGIAFGFVVSKAHELYAIFSSPK